MENAQDKSKLKFGLVGKDISYSFSRGYFKAKFDSENLPNSYVNFDLQSIDELSEIIKKTSNLKGLNVTIPYKEQVIPLLDKLNKKARDIGAVNTIRFTKKKKLVGYNTDFYGFKNSIKPHLKSHHKKALILGTGGASKAIAYALKKLKLNMILSRVLKRKMSPFCTQTYQIKLYQTIQSLSIVHRLAPFQKLTHVQIFRMTPSQKSIFYMILFIILSKLNSYTVANLRVQLPLTV
ncbi:Shikimate 5-dehydrogenase I alpha [Winogradskyella psychrotolerans RS-3]|uniref:Shikimate 5-dehydrogenase I alpha n=1 Tax=Winogradskyella psychrotolerans RS-3 TaxID=641526 RepID=S7VU75_9FLAO|nr:Shikimate 5-dehydrogenase I alpha [Winogradskyella psychrotolerans RS-3]